MNSCNILAIIGLILDMIGVGLIFIFGIPSKIDTEGHTYIITENVDENEKKEANKYKRFSWMGLFLVFLGFLLQCLNYII